MGLDNMPMNYPCDSQAVKDEHGSIDCKATQQCGNCTWKNEYEKDPMTKDTNPIYGMFGTNCWYRGKFGNNMLDDLKKVSDDFEYEMPSDFYGDIGNDGDSQGGISASTCLEMSNVMLNYVELWSKTVSDMVERGELKQEYKEGYIMDWVYAAWWLKFVGKNADGSAVWY